MDALRNPWKEDAQVPRHCQALRGHEKDQLLDLIFHSGTSRAAPLSALIFPGD